MPLVEAETFPCWLVFRSVGEEDAEDDPDVSDWLEKHPEFSFKLGDDEECMNELIATNDDTCFLCPYDEDTTFVFGTKEAAERFARHEVAHAMGDDHVSACRAVSVRELLKKIWKIENESEEDPLDALEGPIGLDIGDFELLQDAGLLIVTDNEKGREIMKSVYADLETLAQGA